ncbi:hypothetical protein ACPW7J_10805 [Ihubacter sp. rT4E-8]|uniref:hypothetical protein n=1 Tax=Ihubacter sp. rT4E-8 TaxID=3242369 RepID=UPI003CE91EAA
MSALLELVSYVPQAESQSNSVLSMFMYCNTLFPALFCVLSLALGFVIRKNEKRVPEMKAELAQRETRTEA